MSQMGASMLAILGQTPWITKLSPDEEQEFRTWVTQNKIPVDPNDPLSDYDMRGFWKAMKSGDVIAMRDNMSGHFPDRWKTPLHKSFSNESIFSDKTAPHWEGNKLVSPAGKTVFSE